MQKKIDEGKIDKPYIRHFKFKIKNESGDFTEEAKRYIDVIDDELVLKFDTVNLDQERIDKTVEFSNWSFSLRSLRFDEIR